MFTSITDLYTYFNQSTGVTTDTRNINKDNIFFALKGDNFNGNKFAQKAIELGAKYVVIDEPLEEQSSNHLLVPNVLTALQDLASHHRDQLDIPFIGITGTNGKTTTKELIATTLQTKYNTLYTKGNLNNHIGVPLTLLEVTEETEIAIIEMGANHIGDIEFLCNIAKPTHGLITNIGKAHLEGFGSVEGIARTKSELYRHLLDNQGTVFINSDSEILKRMSARFEAPYFYSQIDTKAYCYAQLIEVNPYIKLSYNDEKNKQTNIIGKYNFENILAALTLSKYFEIEDKNAIKAICGYTSTNNRSQVINKGSNKIILDAYNANPTSMSAALESFDSIKHDNKVVILGDMFELGKDEISEHKQIAEILDGYKFSNCYFVGNLFSSALTHKNTYSNKNELIEDLKNSTLNNSLILIKGSRGIGLETIVDHICD